MRSRHCLRRWIESRKFSRLKVPTHGTAGRRRTSSRRTSNANGAAAWILSSKKTSSTCGSIRAPRKPPFKSVISHGLTVDERGRKMAKSLGNSEDAVDAVGRMGADVLRLVYASLDYTAEITLGQTIFSAVSESYR